MGATVLNADGTVRWLAKDRMNGSGVGQGTGVISSNVADLNLDGKPEIIAGNTAYNADGTTFWWNKSVTDGYTAVGNLDDDPYPEIVLSTFVNVYPHPTSLRIYLLEHDGTIKWGPVYLKNLEGITTATQGGAPMIADFDGDGEPEIGIKGLNTYYILDKAGKVKQTLAVPYAYANGDTGGYFSSPTVFDLNGDGHPNVMFNSDGFFRIFDGKLGTLLFEEKFGTSGIFQNVIVADVSGNGHAEIVVAGSDRIGTNASGDGLRVYRAKNNDWVGARRIWNQPSYHVTNINDDGSIPQYEAPSWLLNNTYRCQAATDPSTGSPYLASDLSASFVRVDMANYPGSVAITVRVGNGGAKPAAAGLRTAFYDGDPNNGGVLLGSALTTKSLASGEYEDVAVTWNTPGEGNHTIFIKADADNTLPECDKTNNSVSTPVYIASGKPDLSIVTDDIVASATIPEGSLTNILVTIRNIGALQTDNVLVRLYAGNPATGGKQIGGDQVVTSIAAGSAVTLKTIWNTLGAQGVSYLYAVVDPSATTVDVNRGNNTANRQVTVTAAEKPDMQISVDDITISPASPLEGDTLTVNATIHNRGSQTGNVKVALYDGNPASGGVKRSETVISPIIPLGGSAQAALALDTTGLSGSHTFFVRIDPDNNIDEADETNNQASRNVTIAPAGLAVSLATDKSAYSANENVLCNISLAEVNNTARSLTYDLLILDANGVQTASVAETALTLGANSSLNIARTWNGGSTYAGSYTVMVRIRENSRIIAKATATITITPAKTVDAKIVVDKTAYHANEQVAITATISGTSPNYIFNDLSAKTSVLDSTGQALFTATRTIPSLSNGQRVELKSYWNTGTLAPGTYLAVIEVKDSAGTLISTGTQNIVISSVIAPSAVLKGTVTVDKQSLLSGETVNISYSLTNKGNVDLPTVGLSVLTANVANQTVYNTLAYQATLPMGASYAATGQIDTTGFSAKDYLVILRANINGVEESIASSYFRVEGAPSAPALAGPANGSGVTTFTPVLSVSNASDPNDDTLTYEFEIYADSGLTSLIASSGALASDQSGITTWTVPAPLTENQTCYWRARAYDGKLYGPWMTLASLRVNTVNDPPTAPTISAPANDTSVAVLSPTLTVNNASDPDSANLTYNFDVALDADFNQIVATAKGIAGGQGTTSWQTSSPLAENGWYYWRAQADDWLVEGPWSATSRFFVNTANDPPSPPVITAPVNNATVAALETDIVVTNSTDPDSTSLTYYFEADAAATFDSPGIIRSGSVAEGQGTTLWHVSGLKDNTRYYLRVKASDGMADGPWSTATFFANTANDPPTTPVLANPSDGSGVSVFAPALAVHNATDPDGDALTYEFAVYADAAMTNLVTHSAGIAQTDGATSWTTPVALTENATYYWHARAFDGTLASGWTPAASFMVNTANDAPGPPALSAPVTGSSVTTLTPTLAIVNAVDPDSSSLTYEFELYAGTTLVASSGKISGNNSGITSWTPVSPLSDNTVYQWRARAFDGDRYGQWMDMATFTTHTPQASIHVDIDFEPETLNKNDYGKWVIVRIELPRGYKARDVDISSIRLENTVHAESWPFECRYHHHEHGCGHDRYGHHHEVLIVKFRRSEVINVLPVGKHVPVHVTGKLGETMFEGVDVIRVITSHTDHGGCK